jgi:hypothetical protein
MPSTPSAFITYCGTSPKPTNWQTTSCIRPRKPPSCLWARPGKGCACVAEWFQCHRQELQAVFPRYFQRGWLRELVSCSWVRKELREPTESSQPEMYNTYNAYNAYQWYNNYHSQDRRMFPVSIRVRIQRTWFQCQSLQMLRTEAKPKHTRQGLATQ